MPRKKALSITATPFPCQWCDPRPHPAPHRPDAPQLKDIS